MAITVTNSFNNTDSWDANKVNTNFSDILSWANGGITTANLSGSAGIVNSQLANDDFVFTINFNIDSAHWGTTLMAYAGFPYIGSDTWTVIGYQYVCTDAGSGDGSFNITLNTRTGTSIPATETTILGTTLIDRYDGSTSNGYGLGRGVLNVDITTTAAKTGFFLITKVAAGTGVMSSATDTLNITLLLKRKAGLGSF